MNNLPTKSETLTILQNEPLIIFDDSTRAVDFSNNANHHNNIFIGIGLATSSAVSSGLPFDVLGMLLVAEKIRSAFHFEKIIIQIADEHALGNKLTSAQIITRKAERTKNELTHICRNLGLQQIEIFKSSDVDKGAIATELAALSASNTINEYQFLELVDMEFFRRFRNVTTKISWIIPGVVNNGHDERFFDDQFARIWKQPLNIIHVEPGFTFDPKIWRSSPYIHNAAHERIVVQPGEDVKAKFASAESLLQDKGLHGARNHLKRIVRLFEALCGALESAPLEDKVQTIVERLAA